MTHISKATLAILLGGLLLITAISCWQTSVIQAQRAEMQKVTETFCGRM